MNATSHKIFFGCLALAPLAPAMGSEGTVVDSLKSLLENSPFPPAPKPEAPPPVEAIPGLELRSILVENGEYVFSVFDPAEKRSHWIRLNETGGSVVARSYDAKSTALQLDYQGRAMQVTLKQSKIAGSGALPSNKLALMGRASLPASSASGAGNTIALSDAQLSELVTAEIKVRRLARLQGSGVPPVQKTQ